MIATAARQIINRLVVLAVCLTPLFYIPRFTMINALNDSKWFLLHVIGGSLVIMWGVYVMAGGAKRPGLRAPGPTHTPLLAYGALMVASALFSGEPAFSLTASIIPFYFLVISFTPLLLGWTAREIARLLIYAFGAGGLVALSVMWQTVHSESFFKVIPYQIPFTEARISMLGTIGNPEYVGTFLAPILLLGAPWLMRGPRMRRAAMAAGAALIGLVLLLTTARGAALGFVAGGALTLMLAHRTGWWRLGVRAWTGIGAGTAAVVALAAVFSFPNPLNVKGWEILPRFARVADMHSESIYERILFYSIGAEMIAANPVFGVGEGMFGARFYPTLLRMSDRDPGAAIEQALEYLNNRVASKAHNDFLEVWAENGTPGFLALLLAVIITLWLGWKGAVRNSAATGGGGNEQNYSEEQNRWSDNRHLLLALYPAFVCILLYSFFSFPMQMPSRGPLFWAMWGCLAQAIRLRETPDERTQ